MGKHTVDSFIVELGFTEKVMAGLAKVEKQVLPIAKRIEDRLNKAFNTTGHQQMQKTFNRIVKDADSAGRKIHKSLTAAFDVKNAGRTSMRGFENQSNAMARRIAKEIQKAYNVRPPRLPPLGGGRPPRGPGPGPNAGGAGGGGGGGPRGGGRRNNTENWINSHLIRNSDNGMTNTMGSLGMVRQREAMRTELASLANRHRGDSTTHEYERAARQVIFGYKQQVAAQRAANQATQRAAFMQHSLESSTLNLVKGFASVYMALEFFKNSLQEGAMRTQAHTMGIVAYGTEAAANRMTLKSDEISNSYGLDTLSTRKQIAQMRMTMPKSFEDDKIAKLYENESVFAHTTGMGQDQVGRLNYAMMQIAASAKLMGQDWMQVVNASPALVNKMIDKTGATDQRDMKDKLKKYTGAQIVEMMMDVMEPTDKQREMAQKNIIAAQGRLNNAIKNGQNEMFTGMEKGVAHFMEVFTTMLNDTSGNLHSLGELLGWIANQLSPLIQGVGEFFMNMDSAFFFMKQGLKELAESSPAWAFVVDAMKWVGSTGVQWVAVATVIRLLLSFAGLLTGLSGLAGALGVGGGAAAAGAAAGGGLISKVLSTAGGRAFGLAAAAVIGTELGNIVFDKWIPEFQKFAHNEWGWGGKDGTETTHDGTAIKDSPVDALFTFAGEAFDFFKNNKGSGLQDPALLGYKMYTQLPPQPPVFQFKPIELFVTSSGKVDLLLPDGTIQRATLDSVREQHEIQMMSSGGLQDSWQGTGLNAGWSPSSLSRSKS